jgi:hypothetical protein
VYAAPVALGASRVLSEAVMTGAVVSVMNHSVNCFVKFMRHCENRVQHY